MLSLLTLRIGSEILLRICSKLQMLIINGCLLLLSIYKVIHNKQSVRKIAQYLGTFKKK